MKQTLFRLEIALTVGLALRIFWVLSVPMVLASDPAAYSAMARNLLEHGVYGFRPDEPSVTWPPGTSFLFAAIYALPGSDEVAAKAANVILSTLNIWLTWAVGRRLFGDRAGLVAAWAMALWPQMIYFTTLTASETPFIALILSSVLFWERARTGGRWSDVLLTGLFLGMACYVRSVALLLPVALLIGELIRGGSSVPWMLGRLLAVGVVMAACIAPWTLRNHAVFGTTIVMSANFGATFYFGNGPGTTGRHGSAEVPEEIKALDYVTRSEILTDLAWAEIRSDPQAFVLRSLMKLRIIHDRESIGVEWNRNALRPLVGDTGMTALKAMATLYWWVILGSGLAAVVWHLFHGMGWRIIGSVPLAVWGYFATVHSVILAADRFHMAQASFIAMLGASMLAGLGHGRRPPGPSGKPLKGSPDLALKRLERSLGGRSTGRDPALSLPRWPGQSKIGDHDRLPCPGVVVKSDQIETRPVRRRRRVEKRSHEAR